MTAIVIIWKRADHYFFLRVEFTDSPDTLEYSVNELLPGKIFSIGMRIGFKVEPRVTLYLRQVVEDLVAARRLDLVSAYTSLRTLNIPGDFRFTVIHRVFSPSSDCLPGERRIMNLYERLRKIGLDTTDALGLDTSNTTIENVPLILASRNRPRRIKEIFP